MFNTHRWNRSYTSSIVPKSTSSHFYLPNCHLGKNRKCLHLYRMKFLTYGWGRRVCIASQQKPTLFNSCLLFTIELRLNLKWTSIHFCLFLDFEFLTLTLRKIYQLISFWLKANILIWSNKYKINWYQLHECHIKWRIKSWNTADFGK